MAIGTCLADVDLPTPNTIDNCDQITRISCERSDGELCSAPFPKGTTTVTYFSSDRAGNSATCTVRIVVEDNELPTALCRGLSTELNDACEATITPEMIDAGSIDNCEIISMDLSISKFNAQHACQEVPVILTVTDCGDNTAQCETVVFVEDAIPPTIIQCPQDITIPISVSLDDLSFTGLATGVDNCSSVSVANNDIIIARCPDDGEDRINRTWVLTDQCGNSSSCLQTIIRPCVDTLCQDFTNGTVEGWYSNDDGCGGRDGVTITIGNDGPAGLGDNVLYGEDECGTSFLINRTDFSGDWTENESDCFCWDYKIYEDANSATVIPVYSNLNIWYSTGTGADPRNNNVHRATFITNVATTENSNWVRICAPIETCSPGDPTPSNTYGSWIMSAGSTCTDSVSYTHLTLPTICSV